METGMHFDYGWDFRLYVAKLRSDSVKRGLEGKTTNSSVLGGIAIIDSGDGFSAPFPGFDGKY